MKYDKSWYSKLDRSSLSPPSWVFGIVWPILYISMAVAAYLIWTHRKCFPLCPPLVFFLIQLGFNLIWTTLFFKNKQPRMALIDLILIIVFTIITMIKFKKVYPIATYILIPYFLWLCFAFYLNLHIVLNN